MSPSLWVWMPTLTPPSSFTTRTTTDLTSDGRAAPVVSHKTNRLAPAAAAVLRVARAYSGSAAKPVKKCSASKKTSSISWTRKATEFSIISRLRSSVVRKAVVTCSVQDLPTTVAAVQPEAKRALRLGSSSGFRRGLWVEPKATSREFLRGWRRIRPKNSSSFWLAPGQPPSM